jgi:hypothetical protein
MSGIMGKLVVMLKRMGYLGMQYFYTILHWNLRFFKVQLLNIKKKKAQKNMEKAYSGLGAEIYSLYKQGDESDWKNMPAVQQEIKEIEEAESKVFQVDAGIDEVNNAYLSKKEEIREKYTAKRAAADVGQSETFD